MLTQQILLAAGCGGVVGIVLFMLFSSVRRRRAAMRDADSKLTSLQDILIDGLSPVVRLYIEESDTGRESASKNADANRRRTVQRVARLGKNRNLGATLLEDVVVGTALVELKLNDLTQSVRRLEASQVTQTNVAWIVLTVLGVVMGLFAAISRLMPVVSPAAK